MLLVIQPIYANEVSLKEEELGALRQHISRVQQAIESVRGKLDLQQEKLRNSERDINHIVRRLRQVGQSLETKKQRLKHLKTEQQYLAKEYSKLSALLAKQVRAAYIIGRQERIKLLLNQQDPGMLSRTFTYYEYFNRARIRQMQLTQESLTKLKHVEGNIEVETLQLLKLRQQREQEYATLRVRQTQREDTISQLSKEIKTKNTELKGLKDNELQLGHLIHSLRQAISGLSSETSAGQRFFNSKRMLIWPSSGKVTAHFGERRKRLKLRWDGVLIGASLGTDVRAIFHGRIAFADWFRGFGLLVIMDHGDGYMSLYGYNQSIYKETGDWVEAGEIIAGVGKSGGREKAGLYFGIRHQGKPLDPSKWCLSKKRG